MDIIIRQDRCIGCGECVRDCLRELFRVEDGKARLQEGVCIRCGHCVAVCPADAIRLPGGAEEEIRPYVPEAFDIPPERLLNFLRFRRSVRRFRDRPVEPEKLDAMLEAARYAPTGGNQQMTRYILLEKDRAELTGLALKTLYDAAGRLDEDPALRGLKRYQDKWRSMYPAWQRGEDRLFYNAPCVWVVVARNGGKGTGRLDAGLAAANMELTANALGLGACYVGFFTSAAALEPELYRRLGLREGEKVVAVLAVGYPDVKYRRTVNRNPADVTRM